MSIVVVESGGCVSVCGRKEEDVSFSEHTTRIGRERVRVHPSQRERDFWGHISLHAAFTIETSSSNRREVYE